MKKSILALSLLLSLFIVSCSSDDNGEPEIPETPQNKQHAVNLTVDIGSESVDGNLLFGNLSKVITEPRTGSDKLGYKGLIVYCKRTSEGLNESYSLTAFDLACPYCWDGTILSSTGNPDNSYECKVCGLYTFINKGSGFFPNHENHDPLIVYLTQYKVTKTSVLTFEINNPE